RIDYWTPKADWIVTRAEIISVAPEDRSAITVSDVLSDLAGDDAPQIWKRYYWATNRDRRLLDRLSAFPRLRQTVRQPKETSSTKPWLIAEGFQPFGTNDAPSAKKILVLPGKNFIPATSKHLNLFLLEQDCITLSSNRVEVRRLIQDTRIFEPPHVLV